MRFKHSKLRGRIAECGTTQAQLAAEIGINKSSLSQKLNGNFSFTASEMLAICKALNIPKSEISEYFFCE